MLSSLSSAASNLLGSVDWVAVGTIVLKVLLAVVPILF